MTAQVSGVHNPVSTSNYYELLHNGNDDVDYPTEVTDGGDRNVWGDVNSPTGVKIVKLVNY